MLPTHDWQFCKWDSTWNWRGNWHCWSLIVLHLVWTIVYKYFHSLPTKEHSYTITNWYSETWKHSDTDSVPDKLQADTPSHLCQLRTCNCSSHNHLKPSTTEFGFSLPDLFRTLTGGLPLQQYYSSASHSLISCHSHTAQSASYCMVSGVTTESILNHCRLRYPNEPEFGNKHYTKYGLSIVDQHLAQARYYLDRHEPLASVFDLCLINTKVTNLDIAKLIQLKLMIYWHFRPTEFQQEYLDKHREQLNQLECCHICGIPLGGYCNSLCPTRKDSYSGPSSLKPSRKHHRRSYQRKNTTRQPYPGQERETQDKELASEDRDPHISHLRHHIQEELHRHKFAGTRD